MKNTNMLLAIMLAIGTVSLPAHASKGQENGQPFKALQAQIDYNRTLIEINASAVAELNESISTINLQMADLELSINDIDTRVMNNTAQIVAALARVTTAEDGIQALGSDLSNLAEQHASDMEDIDKALNLIGVELTQLNNLRQALADELNAKLLALNSEVDDNALAIDSLLLQLVTVNAQLTGINSSIMDLSNQAGQLEAAHAEYADQLAALTQLAHELENAVDTLEGFHLFTFEGIQTNLPVESLTGWTACFQASYAGSAHPEDMLASCTGQKIMLACRPQNSDTLTVAAYANRDEVFLDTGARNNVVHTANGVDWYFSDDYSMGFAPVGEGVIRDSGDVKNSESPHRLSWHTHNNYTSGWRCGSAALNGNSTWQKLIYQAD